MFDEANLYANVPDEQLTPGQSPYPNEASVPALPAPGQGTQIPTGAAPGPDGIGQGAWSQPPYEPPPGTTIIPTGSGQDGAYQSQDGWIEPDDTSQEAAGRSAGLTAVFVATSIGVGYALGGWKGATAGLLLSGALTNGYRASKNFGSTLADQKHEAIVSSVFAAAGLGVGGYVAYKAYEGRGGDEESED